MGPTARRRPRRVAHAPSGAKSPRGVVFAACGTSLGDDEEKLEDHDVSSARRPAAPPVRASCYVGDKCRLHHSGVSARHQGHRSPAEAATKRKNLASRRPPIATREMQPSLPSTGWSLWWRWVAYTWVEPSCRWPCSRSSYWPEGGVRPGRCRRSVSPPRAWLRRPSSAHSRVGCCEAMYGLPTCGWRSR